MPAPQVIAANACAVHLLAASLLSHWVAGQSVRGCQQIDNVSALARQSSRLILWWSALLLERTLVSWALGRPVSLQPGPRQLGCCGCCHGTGTAWGFRLRCADGSSMQQSHQKSPGSGKPAAGNERQLMILIFCLTHVGHRNADTTHGRQLKLTPAACRSMAARRHDWCFARTSCMSGSHSSRSHAASRPCSPLQVLRRRRPPPPSKPPRPMQRQHGLRSFLCVSGMMG